MRALLLLLLLSLLIDAKDGLAGEAGLPPREGLVLWLDASDAASVKLGGDGMVQTWTDRAGGREGRMRGQVRKMAGALNGLDVLRFGEAGVASGCDFPAWSDRESPISIFIVWRRTPEQASIREWQRLIACETPDRKKGFCITGNMKGGGGAVEPVLYTVSHVTAAPLPFTVGMANAPSTGNPLSGDIAEILVYNRRFDDADEFHRTEAYLMKKWSCGLDLSSQGWLRPSNRLPPAKGSRTDLPLHDPENRGGWVAFPDWTDEFNGPALDATRWYDHNPDWHGRAPARYLPRNVAVTNGLLGVTMSRDAPAEPLRLYGEKSEPYHTYAAGSVVSRRARTYGVFEIRCRAMASHATSAWWFIGASTNRTGGLFNNEIDVFEIGGTVPGEESRCGGNLHVTKAPDLAQPFSVPAGWNAPFRFKDDFHVFGLEWGPEFIRWYLDGALQRSVRNTHWHTPLYMLFDTEIWSWWPAPKPEEFPSTFAVDYVRAWTRADWPEPAGLEAKPFGPAITRLLEAERSPVK